MDAVPSVVLHQIARHLNKNEMISLATAMAASTHNWRSGSIIELPNRSKHVLLNHPEYPAIKHFEIPPWPSILAGDIAAMLQCINARVHLKTLVVKHQNDSTMRWTMLHMRGLDRTPDPPQLVTLDCAFLEPLIGSSALETLDCALLDTGKPELVDMFSRLITTNQDNARTQPICIVFPRSWCKHDVDYGEIDAGDVDDFDVTPMLDMWWVGNEVFETFVRQYARHKSSYVERCFECGEIMEIGERRACYSCFRVFGIGCEGFLGTCSFKCVGCDCIICLICLDLGVGNTCDLCHETYCSHCRSDAEYQVCSDAECSQKQCQDCCDPNCHPDADYDLSDEMSNVGYMVSCADCDRQLCEGCDNNSFYCAVCGSTYCETCQLGWNTDTTPCDRCSRRSCYQCITKECSGCDTVLCQDCSEERMVTSHDSITYCDNCTQFQSCAVCTCPYIPGDEADDGGLDTMCLDCMRTGMEVVSEESIDN